MKEIQGYLVANIEHTKYNYKKFGNGNTTNYIDALMFSERQCAEEYAQMHGYTIVVPVDENNELVLAQGE